MSSEYVNLEQLDPDRFPIAAGLKRKLATDQALLVRELQEAKNRGDFETHVESLQAATLGLVENLASTMVSLAVQVDALSGRLNAR